MSRRLALLGFAAALLSSSGCSEETHTPTAPAASITVTAAPTAVVADAVNTVTVSVTDTGGGPVTVTTNRGTFPGGVTSASVTGASGTIALLTCDAATAGCAGTATITATSTTGTATTTVTFGALAPMCALSCGADANCSGLACNLSPSGTGSCSATTPSTCVVVGSCTPSPSGATTETSCTDASDNDCDGDLNCADSDCAADAACTAAAGAVALAVTPAQARLPAVNGAKTNVVVKATRDGAPAAGVVVDFSMTASPVTGALAPAATTGPFTTGADGTVTFAFTANGTAGVATFVASLDTDATVTASATVTTPRLGLLSLPTPATQYQVLGAQGSGWQESGGLMIQALDDTGQPYPEGLTVRFQHRSMGGSTLGAPLAADTASCLAAAGCVAYDAVTDGTGLATAYLYSGTIAGTLVATASATAGGIPRTVTLPSVAVVGAKASGGNFAVVCSPRNIPALAETDCAISLVDAPFTCAAVLKDRYDNLLGTPTQVIFRSEAGAVGQIATTPAYDEGSEPTGQADLGIATQIFNTLGAGLPFDVVPVGETSVTHGLDGCGDRVHNPRDGVVTILAVADGEEAFFDANGNGQFDRDVTAGTSEPFVDQGEPFVDQDDDGVRDADEWFLDLNGNKVHDGPNGMWDAQTKIWTQTVVVYTAQPANLVADSTPTYVGTRWADAGTFADACTATAEATKFAVKAAAPAAIPPTAGTSQEYVVVASDWNLNLLHTGTAYAVAAQQGAKLKVEYDGRAKYADDLGFQYRYWPCDQGTPASCASQCRSFDGDAPCVMRPAVTGFSCGVAAGVTITGGDEPDLGDVTVKWTVNTPWDVYDNSKFVEAILELTGKVAP